MRRPLIAMTLLLAFASAADAAPRDKSGKGKPALDLEQPLVAQVEQIRKDLDEGEVYSEIGQAERGQVRDALVRIDGLVNQTAGAPNPEQKTQLRNDANLVNQILGQAAADSRLVCRREAQIGSLRTTTQCKTVAERRRDAQEAQEALRRNPTGTYNKGG